MEILFLVSGGGGTLRFFHKAQQIIPELNVVGVIADRACGAWEYAQNAGLKNILLNHKETHFQELLLSAIQQYSADVIVTNIHKILASPIVKAFQDQLINLHYSLLPAFGGMIGMKTVEAGIRAGSPLYGATVHRLSDEVDAGPILGQVALPFHNVQEVSEVQDLLFRAACLCLLNAVMDSKQAAFSYYDQEEIPMLFSPGLNFPIELFDEAFWEEVRKA